MALRLAACSALCALISSVSGQKLNEIVVLGSHNSYHLRNPDPIIPEWNYAHPPLAEQAERYNIRHFELDIVRYEPESDDFAIAHIPTYDQRSNCDSLRECTRQLSSWTRANPNHLPISIFLNNGFRVTSRGAFGALERIFSQAWGTNLLTAAELRGNYTTLREALIENNAWPNVEDVRGQVFFMIDNTNYLNLADEPLGFVIAPFSTADTAGNEVVFFGVDDVTAVRDNAQAVNDLSSRGFILRSQADTPSLYLWPTPTDEQLLSSYFAVLDRTPRDNLVSVNELLAFANAAGVSLSQEQRGQVPVLIRLCSGREQERANFLSSNLTELQCAREAVRATANERIPPRASDFFTYAQTVRRRDATLASGVQLIATDHFVPDDRDSGNYTVSFGNCEFLVSPRSNLCTTTNRSSSTGIAEDCFRLCELNSPEGSGAEDDSAAASLSFISGAILVAISILFLATDSIP